MREIKFRGKIEGGRWVYGSLLDDGYSLIIRQKRDYNIYLVNPKTVGQFTGLTDKKGVEVYEGDIVSVCTLGFNSEAFVTNVLWDKCSFKLANGRNLFYFGQSDFTKIDDAIVIGNIHENYDLIKKEI